MHQFTVQHRLHKGRLLTSLTVRCYPSYLNKFWLKFMGRQIVYIIPANTKNQIEMWILKIAVFAPQLGYHLELYPGQTLNIHVCNPMKKLYA